MSKEMTTTTDKPGQEIMPPRQGGGAPDKFGVFDPEFFLHMHRVAEAMAGVSFLPDGLRMGKDEGGKDVALPHSVVVSNCFMIANQAYRWGMDPFAVAACCSVVRGRLMYEGKLVAAAMESVLTVRLRYVFGKWDGERCIPAPKDHPEEEGKEDFLAVQVLGLLPGEIEEKMIDGNVGSWKTTGSGSPWGGPQKNRRQLRYRGAREWARAFAPGVILGVITDDEVEDAIQQAREARAIPVGTGARERLHIDKPAAGFNADRAAQVIEAGNSEKQMAEANFNNLTAGWPDRDRKALLAEIEKKQLELAAAEEAKKNQTALDLGEAVKTETKAGEKTETVDADGVVTETKTETATDGAAQESEQVGTKGMPRQMLLDYSSVLYRTKLADKLRGISEEFFKGRPDDRPAKDTRGYEETIAVYGLHMKRCKGEISELDFNPAIVEIIGEPEKAAS